jgi:signal transduction histidine kinase
VEIMRLTESDPAASAHARQLLERQLKQLVRLIDDLLDVSRITQGRMELRRERLDITTALRMAVETSRPLIEASRHTLSVMLPPQAIWLDIDPVRLAQVFSNLLNNAAKYTEAGGRIAVTAERRGSQVLVEVKDNGIGIAPEML